MKRSLIRPCKDPPGLSRSICVARGAIRMAMRTAQTGALSMRFYTSPAAGSRHAGPGSQDRYGQGQWKFLDSLRSKAAPGRKFEPKSEPKPKPKPDAKDKKFGLHLHDYVDRQVWDVDMTRRNDNDKIFNMHDRSIIPKSLLASRAEKRYDILETALVLSMHLDDAQMDVSSWDSIHSRLGRKVHLENETTEYHKLLRGEPNDSYIGKLLADNGYTIEDLGRWKRCARAKTTAQAFEAMQGAHKWPRFLAWYTLKRRARSRGDAYQAVRLFQLVFNDAGKEWQTGLFLRTLRMLHERLIEFVPTICRIFVLHCDDSLRVPFVFNQLMWLVAKFGTQWSHADAAVLAEAQKILVDDMNRHSVLVDTKGYVALAYVTHFVSQTRAEQIVDFISRHEYEVSEEERYALDDTSGAKTHRFGVFPYRQGPSAMRILIAKDSYAAINAFDAIPADRRNATLWALLFTSLRNMGQLTPRISEVMWKKVLADKVPLSSFLVQRAVEAAGSGVSASSVLAAARKQGVPIKGRSLLLPINSHDDLAAFRLALQTGERTSSSPSIDMYDHLLRAEARLDPANVWKTYTAMRADGFSPTLDSLWALCAAASDMTLQWEGLYAAQRAVVEFKTWIRGASDSDTDDVLKLYPTQRLFHEYIVMAGRAHYDSELLGVLPWMTRIHFRPDKLCLCALIIYSPNGDYLHQHGLKAGGDWPTDYDLHLYTSQHSV